ncbi:MAG: TolC family protein [Gammaproteobacteria bacterium]
MTPSLVPKLRRATGALAASLIILAAPADALDPWSTHTRIAPDAATPWTTDRLPTVPVPPSATASAARYTLPQLTHLALQLNPQTRAAWAAAQAAAAELGIATADYLPSLDINGTATRSRSATSSGLPLPSQTRYNVNVSVSYLLFDFGARGATREAARANLIAANLEQNQAIQNVVLAVEQAYYQLLGLQALELATEQSLKTAEANLDAVKRRVAAGLATVGDVYQVETTVAQARLNLQQAQGQAAAARGALATAVGLAVDNPLALEPWPAQTPVTEVTAVVEQLLEQARARRPELIAAQARVQAAHANRRAAAAGGRPTLSLAGSSGRTRFVDQDDFPQSSVGLTLTVPLFHGFRTTYEVRQAEADRAAAEAERDRLYYDVQRQVWEAYYNQRTAAATIGNAQALQRSARQAAEVARARYRAGIGTVLEVLSTQTAEAQADVQTIQAQLNWYVGLSQLAHALGTLRPGDDAAPGAKP